MNVIKNTKDNIFALLGVVILLAFGASVYLNNALFIDEITGFKYILWLVALILSVSVALSYYFSSVEKLGGMNKLFALAVLSNLINVMLAAILIFLVQRIFPEVNTLAGLNIKYAIYLISVICASAGLSLTLFNKEHSVKIQKEKGMFDLINYLLPCLSFLLVAMFVFKFRLIMLILVGVMILSLISVKISTNIFKNVH